MISYAGMRGHALIDREVHLPKSWTTDPERRAQAGVPDDIEFLTKPALAAGMICRTQRRVPARWVAGDATDTQCWWLLVRRHRGTGELAFYRCYSPEPVPLRELVRVAGRRWTVEESF